jgi:hypothetical protein
VRVGHRLTGAAARPRSARRPWRAAVLAALALGVLAPGVAGCSALRHAVAAASPTPTGPPPGASQAPGPPLATASAGVDGGGAPPDPANPGAVAAYCFARWQSFDARTDQSLAAGVQRAAAANCFTPDFLDQLTSGQGGDTATAGPGGEGQAWGDLRAEGARSAATVLAATPLGDTAATGRVVYLLNVRVTFTTTATGTRNPTATAAGNPGPAQSVSTPTVTLLRDLSGRWRIAGADLAGGAGDAPGR